MKLICCSLKKQWRIDSIIEITKKHQLIEGCWSNGKDTCFACRRTGFDSLAVHSQQQDLHSRKNEVGQQKCPTLFATPRISLSNWTDDGAQINTTVANPISNPFLATNRTNGTRHRSILKPMFWGIYSCPYLYFDNHYVCSKS